MKKLIESLSPNERKVLPYLKEKKISEICKKSGLDEVSALRALEYLQKKDILKLSYKKKKIVEIGVNGALYRKKGLPERRLLNLLSEKRIMSLDDAQKQSELSDDEFKASIGALKKKAMIEIKNKKIILSAPKEEVAKKTLEENFIDSLPLDYDSLIPEQIHAFNFLKNRKDIVYVEEKKTIEIRVSDLGEKIMKSGIKEENLIEQITPDILRQFSWKGKKFRRYDVASHVPMIYGGKKHFVNQALERARQIWIEMGFKEMTGNFIQSSFWNFDALFTAQDHPVRDMQDTFFIKNKTEPSNKKLEIHNLFNPTLPFGMGKSKVSGLLSPQSEQDKKLVKAVKQAHENGVGGSKGWQYEWDEDEAKRLVLRTHTTCLSAQTLANLKKEDMPAKFFAIGKCFRNETVDWNHGFEFNQIEGIVVDENATFRNLLGYLKKFAEKMGLKKVRFRPAYFPYTEPSLEGDYWDEEKKKWVELFAAGILRPEVTIPLLGKHVPVLAWGPGIDRMIMNLTGIKDMRELYKNDLTQLREIKFFMK